MQHEPRRRDARSRRIPRRDALKGLGALAAAAPAFAAAGCSQQPTEATAAAGGGDMSGMGAAGKTASMTGNQSATAGSAGRAGVSGAQQPMAAGSGGRTAPGSTAGASGAAAGHGGNSVGASGAKSTAAGGGGSTAPQASFPSAASCTLTTTDIEGPFFIDDHEIPDDVSLVRSDIREGLAGVEFRLNFRLLDAKNKCAPIPDAELYIWHCNADGYYSGFDGQDPSKAYTGAAERTPENLMRFCRGIQLSDADGIAGFTTLYPGWYAGRPIHVHLMARFSMGTSRLITTQLYFPAAFTKEVHQSESAYMARAANIPAASLNPPTGNPAMPTLQHTPGLVVGTLNVIVNR